MPIYDQSFRHYEGPRRTRGLWRVVAWQTLRPILRSKLALLLLFGVLIHITFYSVVMYIGATTLKALPEAQADQAAAMAAEQGIPMFNRKVGLNTILFQFVMLESGLVWLLVLVTGGGVISGDLRNAALPLYFSRPLRPRDYIIGKILGLAAAPVVVVSAAVLLIYMQAIAYHFGAADLVRQSRLLLFSVGYAVLSALVVSVLMAACSSACRKASTAAVAFFGLYAIAGAAANLAQRGLRYRQAGTLSPGLDLQIVAHWLFDPDLRRMRQRIRFEQYDVRLAALMLLLYCVIALIILRRNLRVVEVVK